MTGTTIQPIMRNWVKRTITGVCLIVYTSINVYLGLPAILLHALAIQIKCFDEIINIAYNSKKLPNIPYFRTLNWYFVIVANYFFYGETFGQHLDVFVKKYYIVAVLIRYHRFLAFCFYFFGLIWFVNLLRRKVIRQQFSLLAWTHFLLIIIVLQSYMIVENVFEGLIWFVMPIFLVTLNDIFAYVFGRLWGKTPLIQLSPNKTMEGFIGGGVSTIILGAALSVQLCRYQHFVCPTRFVDSSSGISMTEGCNAGYLFQMREYRFCDMFSLNIYPFVWHCMVFSIFASLIAPFGGFCASGFKRAFNMKDFGETFPGHGGIMDRVDCQYLMMSFVNVYVGTFVREVKIGAIFEKIMYMNDTGQLKFYYILEDSLKSKGLLSNL